MNDLGYELQKAASGELVAVGQIPTVYYGFKANHLFAGDGWDRADLERSEAAYRRCLESRIAAGLHLAGQRGLLKVELIDQPRGRSWTAGTIAVADWLEVCCEVDDALLRDSDAWILEKKP